ncbi:MAG: bifunctional [glutamine synthetase] adenylyltransferase/[glutamine synthetase]-adenylyl-L-tyrosine phosphorylase [Sphingomonadales bacterium]|jgi:glutamate-ammonia-ligase adenylyltransferase
MAALFQTPRFLSQLKAPSSYPNPTDSLKFQNFCKSTNKDWSNGSSQVFAGLFEFSPYLSRLLEKNADFFRDHEETELHQISQNIFANLRSNCVNASEIEVMAELRKAKDRTALLTALADIGGLWTLEEVTWTLSEFADLACELALQNIWSQFQSKGEVEGDLRGFFVLALGKLGGHELNFSSDIDIIAIFDNDNFPYTGRKSAGDCAVKITRKLTSLLQDRTEDGYVFRVDLRLRPDPGATPVAVSAQAAETYYQSMAQTWERSAFIKARYCAGDKTSANKFLERLRPFIWRRHLDFAAIDDIHAMKARVHEHHAHKDMSFAGHDVKLGIGGIREIEFYAQIHQLISGGRRPDLQKRPTLKTLKSLSKAGDISVEIWQDLQQAYVFYRTIEHRLQMIDDQQTHRIPTDTAKISSFCHFAGYDDPMELQAQFLNHLKTTHGHYEKLLPEAKSSSINLAQIKKEFPNPAYIETLIEGWRSGRYRALRTARAQQLLEQLLPDLLRAFAETADPELSLKRFDKFLSQLPSGVQLFSLFKANPKLLGLISNIMGYAPALADQLARRPVLLDSFLSVDFFSDLAKTDDLRKDLKSFQRFARDYEDILDRTRIWVNERRFQIGVLMLEGLLDPISASQSLTRLADACIQSLLPEVIADFKESAGAIPEGHFIILALGGYGARALTYTSDLDLVFLYECPEGSSSEGGRRSFAANQYYSRLSQRLISALSVLTSEGRLFEIDMRLRPSGRAGIIAVSLNAFENYQDEDAWSWEHMSLTKARPIAVSEDLQGKIEDSLNTILSRTRSYDNLKNDIRAMRERYDQEFKDKSLWSLMTAPGGLSDANWLVQALLIGHSKAKAFQTEFAAQIETIRQANILSQSDSKALFEAWTILFKARALKRLLLGPESEIEKAPDVIKQGLAKLLGHANFQGSCSAIAQAKVDIARIFNEQIGYPDISRLPVRDLGKDIS